MQMECQEVWVFQQGMGVEGIAEGECSAQVEVHPMVYPLASRPCLLSHPSKCHFANLAVRASA